MVGYLIIHNLLIPLVRNLGAGGRPFDGVHYWFLLHIILLIQFFRYDFDNKPKSLIPLTIWASIYATSFGLIELLFSLLGKKVNVGHFSSAISILSIAIFFIGFFIYFKQFITWESKNPLKRQLVALSLGLLHFGIQYNIEDHVGLKVIKKSVKKEEVSHDYSSLGCQGAELSLDSSTKVLSPGPIEIINCGFKYNLNLFKGEDLLLTNNSKKEHLIRLERLSGKRWKFIKIIKPQPGEKLTLEKKLFEEKGIYQLRSPTSKEIGIHIIINGNIPEKMTINPKEVMWKKHQ